MSINLTSLIDVVLLLLIFFMISTTFILHPGLKVDLPSSSVEEVAQEEEDIIVVVTSDDQIMIADEYFTYETLYEKLAAIKREKPDSKLIIQADETASHGAVVEVRVALYAVEDLFGAPRVEVVVHHKVQKLPVPVPDLIHELRERDAARDQPLACFASLQSS